MPGVRAVSISVLQAGWAHCLSCVRIVGFGAEGVAEAWARLKRAQAPLLGQEWPSSVRWSRQNLLGGC